MSQTKKIYLTTTLWLTNDQVFHVVIYTEWEADKATTQEPRHKKDTHTCRRHTKALSQYFTFQFQEMPCLFERLIHEWSGTKAEHT